MFCCRSDNKCLLSALVLISFALVIVIVSRSTKCRPVTVVFVAGVIFTYCHRSANGTLMCPLLYTDGVISQSVWDLRCNFKTSVRNFILNSIRFFIFTSTKEVMFLPVFVCLFVCLFVCVSHR